MSTKHPVIRIYKKIEKTILRFPWTRRPFRCLATGKASRLYWLTRDRMGPVPLESAALHWLNADFLDNTKRGWALICISALPLVHDQGSEPHEGRETKT